MKNLVALLLIITSTLNVISCGRDGDNNELMANAEKNLPMETDAVKDGISKRINLQTVSFDVPEGFEDKSNYRSFTKPNYKEYTNERYQGGEDERVSAAHFIRGKKISDGEDAISVKDIESARESFHKEIEGLKEKLKELYGIKALTMNVKAFMDKQSVSKEKYPTLMTGRVMGDPGSRSVQYQREAYVFDTQTTFFYLIYVTHENGAEVQQRFERMVESLKLTTPNFAGDHPTSDGYVRRFAGEVTVEIPKDILPDRKFVYERYWDENDPDKEKKVLRLTLLEPDDQEKLSAMEDADSIDQDHVGTIKDERQENVETKYYKGVIGGFTKVNYPGFKTSEYSVARKWVKLNAKDETVMVLQAKSPIEKEEELNAELEKWMQTFVPATERGKK